MQVEKYNQVRKRLFLKEVNQLVRVHQMVKLYIKTQIQMIDYN